MPGKPLHIKSNDFSFAKGLGKYLFWNHECQGYQAESKKARANPSSIPNKEYYRNRGFFYMLIKWLYLFWEFPGLSMAVTVLFHKLIYFFNGICRDPCFNSSWLFRFVCFVFLPPPRSHLKNPFPVQHVWRWLELWEVFGAPKFCSCSQLLTFSFEVFPSLECPLAISVVAFTKMKLTSVCSSPGKGWWAVFWQLYIKCRWLHECTFCLAQYINHNPQLLPKELEWIKLFNKTLLTWINSFLFCI